MTRGDVIARDCWSNDIIRLRFDDGIITERERAPGAETGNWWIAPGLIDLQVNGFLGIDFQSDVIDRGQLERAVNGLHQAGCSRFMLTLVTEQWPRLIERLTTLRRICATSPLLNHAVIGWHIEGPFLSSKPGFYGAHDPDCFADPTPVHIRQLRAATGKDRVILTLAPERAGAIEAVRLAVSMGIKVFLGHTDASAETLAEAIRAGATAFTHVGNGCPPLWDRHDNITWRVLDQSDLVVTVIPDRIHVAPPLFRIIHRVKQTRSIVYISDAMAAAGMPPGRYKLREIEIDVGTDGVVRMPGTSQYAGSSLCPIAGVSRAAQMLGCPWQSAWANYSLGPAELMALPIDLTPGMPADFCLIKTSEDGRIDGYRSFVGGKEYAPLAIT
ncbi:MAG: N-acetylglucosamine-6-phosphate deacetylase [Verrucomicrobia bacterium]|nr:N-acetylglucosamine-6-phosphate deacetylase [Verrucomicrobiota bacterium]